MFRMMILACAAALTMAAHAGDVPKAFDACSSCHAVVPGKTLIGPSLFGIIGRKAGTAPGFDRYSSALKNSQIVWTPDTLKAFIAKPHASLHDNKMAFGGLHSASERDAVVKYLATLK